MDRRTGADRDNNKSLPTGQTSRGYAKETSRNPKSNSSRRPDVTRSSGPDAGADVNLQTTRIQTPAGYPSANDPNRFGKGSGSTEPDPGNINRGYTQVTPGNVPAVRRVTSANRQNFGIDPGTPPQPQGDDTSNPTRPHYGVGTTGE